MDSHSDSERTTGRVNNQPTSTTIYWERWATILQVAVYAATLLSMLIGAGMYLWG